MGMCYCDSVENVICHAKEVTGAVYVVPENFQRKLIDMFLIFAQRRFKRAPRTYVLKQK